MKRSISLVLVLAFDLASVSLDVEDTSTAKAEMPTTRVLADHFVTEERR
jgi:hypothetical protein